MEYADTQTPSVEELMTLLGRWTADLGVAVEEMQAAYKKVAGLINGSVLPQGPGDRAETAPSASFATAEREHAADTPPPTQLEIAEQYARAHNGIVDLDAIVPEIRERHLTKAKTNSQLKKNLGSRMIRGGLWERVGFNKLRLLAYLETSPVLAECLADPDTRQEPDEGMLITPLFNET